MRSFYLLLHLLATLAIHAQPGTPDITFGNGGRVNVDLGFFSQAPIDLKVLPDGKMLVGGIEYDSTSNVRAFLTRLTAQGEIDSTFGVNGLAPVFSQPGFDVRVSEIELLPDGKFIVLYKASSQPLQYRTAIRRYSYDGSADNTFGTNGQTISPSGMKFSGEGLAIAPDGNIIVGGVNYTNTQGANFSLLGFKPNGTTATNFGTNGRVEFHLGTQNDFLYNVEVQPDGKIVAAGRIIGDFAVDDPLVLLRLNSNGTPDSTFATNGFFMDTYNDAAGAPEEIHFLPNGDILLTGGSNAAPGQGLDCALYKFNKNGIRDNTFGNDGMRSFDFGSGYEFINASILQTDGKIILSGLSNESFIIARMDAQGEPDQSFGDNGSISNSTFEAVKNLNICSSIQMYPGNKLIAALSYDSIPYTIQKWSVIRLNNDDATNTGSIPSSVLSKKIYPNPTNSGIFTLELTFDAPSELSITLSDAAGKNLQTMLQTTRNAGTWRESLRIPPHFPQGIYFLKVQTGNKLEVLRVIKN